MTVMPQPLNDRELSQALIAVREELTIAWQASDWVALQQIERRARSLAEQGIASCPAAGDVLEALTALEGLYRRIVSDSDAEKERIRKELCDVREKKAAISSYQTTRSIN